MNYTAHDKERTKNLIFEFIEKDYLFSGKDEDDFRCFCQGRSDLEGFNDAPLLDLM